MKKTKILLLFVATFIITSFLTAVFIASPYGTTIYCKLSDAIGGPSNTKLLKLEQIVGASYVGELHQDWMTELAATEYVAGVRDKYTQYLGQSQYKSMKESISGQYRGIGISISPIPNANMLTACSPFASTHS